MIPAARRVGVRPLLVCLVVLLVLACVTRGEPVILMLAATALALEASMQKGGGGG